MNDQDVLSLGYAFDPTRYNPRIGYCRVRALIPNQPAQRYFDVRKLHVPTFDGWDFKQIQVSRHEPEMQHKFHVSLGHLILESFDGKKVEAFCFGGQLQTRVDREGLFCELTSNAPIIKQQDVPGSVATILVDEIIQFIASLEPQLSGHEDEFHSRLAKFEPYSIFLSCLISLKKRLDSVPKNMQRESYRKTCAVLQQVTQILQTQDGWDGRSPTLEELVFNPE
jgi:hypothetical protein